MDFLRKCRLSIVVEELFEEVSFGLRAEVDS